MSSIFSLGQVIAYEYLNICGDPTESAPYIPVTSKSRMTPDPFSSLCLTTFGGASGPAVKGRYSSLSSSTAWRKPTPSDFITAQPTLETLVRLAKELHTTLDDLVFGDERRGPNDDLRLQFEALSQFDEEECKIAKAVLESLILKHNVKRAFVDQMQGAK